METIATIGLDLAKNVFQVHCVDGGGNVVIKRQLRRSEILKFFTKVPACLVAAWCQRSNLAPLPLHPQTVGLYITACGSGSTAGMLSRGAKANSVSTIEWRLSALSWKGVR